MAYKIEEIEGIGPAYGEKLTVVGIKTTDDLLSLCATSKGREDTSGKCGLPAKQLLKWANLADLMRISGIGPEYSELLEAAGVDTVKELRHRNAENLAGAMAKVNETKKLTRAVPAATVVARWIESAKTTDPTISH